MSQSIVAEAREKAEDKNYTPVEMYDEAVSEYLRFLREDDAEETIVDNRNRLVELAEQLGGDSAPTPAPSSLTRPGEQQQYQKPGDRERINVRISDTLVEEVESIVAMTHSPFSTKGDVVESSLRQWVREDRERRLSRYSQDTSDLLDFVEDRIEQLEDDYNLDLSETSWTDEDPDDGVHDGIPGAPTMVECKEEGRVFSWEELKAVSEYVDMHGAAFQLHPSHVDRDLVKTKPDVCARLAFGLLNHNYGREEFIPGFELENYIEKVVPSGDDRPSDYQLFKRNDSWKSYKHRLQELMIEFEKPNRTLWATSSRAVEMTAFNESVVDTISIAHENAFNRFDDVEERSDVTDSHEMAVLRDEFALVA